MNAQQNQGHRNMTAAENKPLAGLVRATAIWTTVLLLGVDLAVAQGAATEPASSQPTTAASTEPSPPTATGPAATGPAATAIATSRPSATQRAVSNSNAPLSLNFKDASLRTVLEYLSEAAGLVIMVEPRIEGRVTLMSRQPVSVEEAVSLLDSELKMNGYAAIRSDRMLKIVTLDQAKKELIPLQVGNDPNKIKPSDRIVTQIIPIRYVDAVRLKADLAGLIPSSADVASNALSNTLIVTGTASTARRLVEIVQAIDLHQSEVSTVRVFRLKNANATSAARLITDIFKEDQPTQAAGFGAGGGGRRAFMLPGMPGGPQAGATEGGGQRGVKVTTSADDRTNTLVVSASPDVLKVIEGVVKDLDADPAEQQAVFVYRLKNAQAVNLQTVLNNIFSGTGTTSGGTTAARQGTGTTGGGFGTSGAFGGRTGSTGGAGARGTSSAGRGLGSGGTGGLGTSGFGTGGTSMARTGTGTGAQGRTTGGGGFAAGARGSATGAMASDLIGQVYVVADADTNSLLITAASKNFDRIKAIIADLDRAVPQVLIKVLIAEVSHDKSLDLGVEFSGMNLDANGRGFKTGTNFGVAAGIAAGKPGFNFTLNESNVTAAIRALAGVAKLDVLSRPYILTGDNQPAQIMVGQEFPLITYSQVSSELTVNNTVSYTDIGIILQVTPHINPQGLVPMDVYAEISEPTGESVPLNPQASSPIIARRFAQSRVSILDGQTIVIGGLMEDRITKSIDKVPFLGDIPGLGLLFQHTVEKKTKTELLIFLTPHVVQQPEELTGMSDAEKKGAKIVHEAVEPGAFEEHLKGMERGAVSRPAPQQQEQAPSGIRMVPWEVPEEQDEPRPAPGEPDEPQP